MASKLLVNSLIRVHFIRAHPFLTIGLLRAYLRCARLCLTGIAGLYGRQSNLNRLGPLKLPPSTNLHAGISLSQPWLIILMDPSIARPWPSPRQKAGLRHLLG